jgi:uncharacterized membrane protein
VPVLTAPHGGSPAGVDARRSARQRRRASDEKGVLVATKVEKSVVVDVPVETAYNQWTQFEEFPQFMGGISEVRQIDDTTLQWVAEIGGVKREWTATILEQVPNEKIAWAATEGATNAGAVYFAPAGGAQTNVRLELEYEPEGVVDSVADKVGIVGRRAEADLEKFKSFIEDEGYATGAWRGSVPGAVGTPGVEAAQASQGDSGKAGVSAKTIVAGAAGAAAAAAGVAAAVKSKSGGSDTESTADAPLETEVVVVETDVTAAPPVTEETIRPEDALPAFPPDTDPLAPEAPRETDPDRRV